MGEEVEVKLTVRSDIVAANLFTAKVNYDIQYLRLNRVQKVASTAYFKNWVEEYTGDAGKISLAAGAPNPGFQTSAGDNPEMATI